MDLSKLKLKSCQRITASDFGPADDYYQFTAGTDSAFEDEYKIELNLINIEVYSKVNFEVT